MFHGAVGSDGFWVGLVGSVQGDKGFAFKFPFFYSVNACAGGHFAEFAFFAKVDGGVLVHVKEDVAQLADGKGAGGAVLEFVVAAFGDLVGLGVHGSVGFDGFGVGWVSG